MLNKIRKKITALLRLNAIKQRKKNKIRSVCLAMIAFENAPIALVNGLTGELVRNNGHSGIKLYR